MKRLLAACIQSFRLRIMGYFFLILLPLIFVSVHINSRSKTALEKQITERTLISMNSVVQYMDLTLQGLMEMSAMISNDKLLVNIFEQASSQPSVEDILNFQQAAKQLTIISIVNKALMQISILHNQSGLLISSNAYGHIQDASGEVWFRRTVEAAGAAVIVRHDEDSRQFADYMGKDDNLDTFHIMRMMNLYGNNRSANVLLLSVNKSYFDEIIRNMLPTPAAQAFLLDERGQLIAHSNPSSEIPAFLQSALLDDQWDSLSSGGTDSQLAIRVSSEHSLWTLVLLQPEKEIYRDTRQTQLYTVFMMITSTAFAVGIAWMLYRSIASPIKSLIAGMVQFRKGNMDTRISHGRKDEFGYLMDSFNALATDQKHLIKDVYEQQLKANKAEMKVMQGQMNPHFLYNTLDSIYSLAVAEEANGIGEMIYNLSRFFRISMDKGRDSFSLGESLEHIKSYMLVQQIRFRNTLTLDIQAEPAALRYMLPKLLLQPLVENAILHGLERKTGPKLLQLIAQLNEDGLLLTVKDNGAGIKAERLSYIREELSKGAVWNAREIGEEGPADLFALRNVAARLGLHYANQARLDIHSLEGEGTTVSIFIPYQVLEQEAGEDEDELACGRR